MPSNEVTKLRREDPRRLDTLRFRAGAANTRTLAGQPVYRYAGALGISPSRASRHCSGDANSPLTGFLAACWRAGLDPHLTPFPWIAEAMAVVTEAQVQRWDTDRLVGRWWELHEREHELEAVENREASARTFDHDAFASAAVAEAEATLELVAITRTLKTRGVNPKTWSGRAS